jgi:enamine deaminase RidA (YjgF/YER057c/UK114 family)
MKNLVAVVRAAKGVPGDVVQLTAYLRDPSPSSVLTVRAAIIDAIGKEGPPALTIVGTTALPEASMQVMISGTAQLRSELPDRTRMIPRR